MLSSKALCTYYRQDTTSSASPKGLRKAGHWEVLKINIKEEVATVVPDKKKEITATVAHAITGQIGEAQSCKIVNHVGYTVIRGSMPKCEHCAKTKAKQKSLPSCVKVVEIDDHPKECNAE
eukprot:15207563-Ditylum_brightwellii.AAC.1